MGIFLYSIGLLNILQVIYSVQKHKYLKGVCALLSTCVCLLKCFDAQFSMSVSEDGFLRVNSGKMPQLALGIIFLAFRLASNWAQAPRSSD